MLKFSIPNTVLGFTIREPKREIISVRTSTSQESIHGQIAWAPENCTRCNLCVEDCPSAALEIITINKSFVMRYDLGKCIFCRQCALSCEQGCFTSSSDVNSLGTNNKEKLEIIFGRQEDIDGYKLSLAK